MEFSRPQKMGGEDLKPQLNEFDREKMYIYINLNKKMVNKIIKVDPAWQQLSSSLALSEEKFKGI